MCTVSIIPLADGFRLVSNRDELNTRPAALAPAPLRSGGRTMIYPIDPRSGGTWVGANDAGLALAVLNVSAAAAGPAAYSRGLIVPPLLELDTLERALAAAGRLDARLFQPFRLVMVQGRRVGVVCAQGGRLSIARAAIDRPLLFTASSLGDAIVEGPRRRLFDRMMPAGPAGALLSAQARFHAHRWPERPEISVWMARADAATVSRTVVDVGEEAISVEYVPLDPLAHAA